jgi:hypothetical protein
MSEEGHHDHREGHHSRFNWRQATNLQSQANHPLTWRHRNDNLKRINELCLTRPRYSVEDSMIVRLLVSERGCASLNKAVSGHHYSITYKPRFTEYVPKRSNRTPGSVLHFLWCGAGSRYSTRYITGRPCYGEKKYSDHPTALQGMIRRNIRGRPLD